MRKIKYEIGSDGTLKTLCENDSSICVGHGYYCQYLCSYCVDIDRSKQIVTCSYDSSENIKEDILKIFNDSIDELKKIQDKKIKFAIDIATIEIKALEKVIDNYQLGYIDKVQALSQHKGMMKIFKIFVENLK